MQISKFIQFGFRVTRKAKFYKRPILSGIPDYHKPNYVDLHDTYQYRTKDQVMSQVKAADYQIQITKQCYAQTDIRQPIKDRKAVIEFHVDQFNFTQLQYERFKVLMGIRYKQESRQVKMACETFTTFQQNLQKLLQQMKEVILQSKRAP